MIKDTIFIGMASWEARFLLGARRVLDAGNVLRAILFYAEEFESRARKLHKQLHTPRTRLNLQVDRNGKAPTCGAFAEPSDGLEPSTPSLPWRCSTN